MALRPVWVVKDLANLLGLDDESVKQMLLPDLESYTSEVRLRTHLVDLLGPSAAAKTFVSKYLALRFPSIASGSSLAGPAANPPSSIKAAPAPTSAPGGNITDALHDAFGPGGKVYQKNRDADEASWTAARGGSAGGKPRSGQNSGTHTPSYQVPRQRLGGAVSIIEKVSSASRLDTASPSSAGAGSTSKGKGKGKASEKIWDKEKSREVKRLESILGDLRTLQEGEGRVQHDPNRQDCFCQARVHPLSAYTPNCPKCGFIICQLHPSHLPCPSCRRTLMSPAQLARLILLVEGQVAQQVAKEVAAEEEAEREHRERLLAESGGGAFPTLGTGSGSRSSSTQPHADNARKVLTIGRPGGKGKATLTTTTYRPSPSPGASRAPTPPPSDIVPRPREGPADVVKVEKELKKVLGWREAEDRPWGNMKEVKSGQGWEYKDQGGTVEVMDEERIGRRKAKKGKMKGLGADGRVVVGASA